MSRWEAIGLQLFEEMKADWTASLKRQRLRQVASPSPEHALTKAILACADGDAIPLIKQARKGFSDGGLPALPPERCAELVSVLRFKQKPKHRGPDWGLRIALQSAQHFYAEWKTLLRQAGVSVRGLSPLMKDESCRYAIKLLKLGGNYKAAEYDSVRDLMDRSRERQGTARPRRTSAK